MKIRYRLTANRMGQDIVERIFVKAQKMMGIGTGDDVWHSGESSLVTELVRRHQRPYCIFDVGANTGSFSEMLLERIGSDRFTIHCFEPGTHAFAKLRKKLDGNHHVVLNNIGLGATAGEFTLYYNEKGSAIASLTKRDLRHFDMPFDETEVVRIDTLDEYCERHEIRRIDLLKLDIEGHELDVLQGGSSKMFSQKAIGMVSFEFGGCNIDTRTFLRDFFYFFQDVDMVVHRITPGGYLHPLPRYKEIYEQFPTTNYVALRL